MVAFAGWEMPIQYPLGILGEHLATRKQAGLFDVSHMGRFLIRGADALPFLQHVLTNNAAALEVGEAQYTLIANEAGGAYDDAYLYRFVSDEYLLVVNAANRVKDWQHFIEVAADFTELELEDATNEIAMLALQGPQSRDQLAGLISAGSLPEPLPVRQNIRASIVSERPISRGCVGVHRLLNNTFRRPMGLSDMHIRVTAGTPGQYEWFLGTLVQVEGLDE